jgi:hypothetical protein
MFPTALLYRFFPKGAQQHSTNFNPTLNANVMIENQEEPALHEHFSQHEIYHEIKRNKARSFIRAKIPFVPKNVPLNLFQVRGRVD